MLMFCSGKNRWDIEDYPEYADVDTVMKRVITTGDALEPMLRRRGVGAIGEIDSGRQRYDQKRDDREDDFERRSPTGGRRSGQPTSKRISKTTGSKGIELMDQQRYQRVGGVIRDTKIEVGILVFEEFLKKPDSLCPMRYCSFQGWGGGQRVQSSDIKRNPLILPLQHFFTPGKP